MARKLQTKSALQKKLEEDILMASKVGDPVWLQQCLSTKKMALDFTDKDGLSAIHLAALECQIDCLKMLIEREQIDVNLESDDGWISLHLAINNTVPALSLNCVNYLITQGADPSRVTSCGLTPMHQAAACGNVDCLKALIDAGGRIDEVDEIGHTPLCLATLWGHRECARILKHYQWQKTKSSEDKIKRQIQIEQEKKIERDIAEKKKEKAEKRLKAQKAYQLWLAKNKFTSNNLFGLDTFDNDTERAASVDSPKHRKGRITSSKVLKSSSKSETRREASRDQTKGANKKVNLIPINSPGSPTPGRRTQIDLDKRLPHVPSPARIRAVQKRGPLQFPVI